MRRTVRCLNYISLSLRRGLGVGFLFLISPSLWADDNVGALWTEVGVTKALPYNLSVDASFEHRTLDWFDESSRYNMGAGLSWKASKHWKVGFGYTFIMKHSPVETSYKNTTETEHKYRNNTTGTKWDATSYLGNPYFDDNGVANNYRGYNDITKNDTRVDEAFWRAKHRLFVDASYSCKFWKTLRISIRERYQMTMVPAKTISRTRNRVKTVIKYRDPDAGTNTNYDEVLKYWQEGNTIYEQDITDETNPGTPTDATTAWLSDHSNTYLNTTETYDHEKGSKTIHILRSRLKLSIDKKGWKWEPYLSVETHNNLGESMHLDKVRSILGVDYSITKKHQVGLGYVFSHENDDDGDQNIHAICVGYNFKF